MSKFVFSENMYGRKVKFLSDEAHMDMPEFYPAVGTVGTVVECYDSYEHRKDWKVQWPEGSTSGDDCWFCDEENVELIEEVDKQMTNEEIWEMLKPKFDKNNLEGLYVRIDRYGYIKEDVYNAIAIAYRSGYERAMKGRPFKIGEKKKKSGHWEPVDPNNLPKEGTRVRYARKFSDDIFNIVSIGTEGIVEYFGEFFGAKFNETYFCSCEHPERFDMWVEDDE